MTVDIDITDDICYTVEFYFIEPKHTTPEYNGRELIVDAVYDEDGAEIDWQDLQDEYQSIIEKHLYLHY